MQSQLSSSNERKDQLCYLDQSEYRGCSRALHNSWLVCFALSFICLLAKARKYIHDAFGAAFLENIVLDLEGMIAEADNRTPLLCLLSVGSDPTNQV